MNWDDVKVFAAAAQFGGARAAAKALKMHHSTVSRRIEALERRLDVRLFDRLPDGLTLTLAGERLSAAAGQFHGELIDVERAIAGLDTALTGALTVTMGDVMARLCIAPALKEFCDAYPNLDLKIVVTYDLLDVSRREADLAIRMDNNPPETLVGKRLFAYYQSYYAAPSYWAQCDMRAAPEKARWIGWNSEEGRFPAWVGHTPFPKTPTWGCFTDIGVQQAAARAGLGLAMLPCMVADADPGLIRVSPAPPVPGRDIWLLTHNDLRKTARVRAFMGFAEKVIRRQKGVITGDLAVGA